MSNEKCPGCGVDWVARMDGYIRYACKTIEVGTDVVHRGKECLANQLETRRVDNIRLEAERDELKAILDRHERQHLIPITSVGGACQCGKCKAGREAAEKADKK